MEKDLFNIKSSTFDSSEFFKLMFENATQTSILILSTEGIILDFNKSFQLSFDYTKEDLVGKSFSMLFTEEDRAKKIPEIELSSTIDRGSCSDRNYLVHKNGNYIWVHGESILSESNGNTFIIKLVFDIHEQKKLEEFLVKANKDLLASQNLAHKVNTDLIVANESLLKISKDFEKLFKEKKDQAFFYETILSNTIDFIYTFDLEGKLTYANKSFLTLLNLKLEDVKGKTFKELDYPPDLVQKHQNQIKKVIETKETLMDSNFYTGQWGTRFYEYIFSPIMNGDTIQGVAGATRDITHRYVLEEELKEKNEELDKINKDLDAFVYTASHDLKAPINNLEGLLLTMEEDLSEDSKKKVGEILELINLSISKFKTTLADLASVGRAQIGGGNEIYSISFKDIVGDIKISMHEDIENTKAIIKEEYEVESINFSRKLLRSILQNLISNALKYNSPERTLELKIRTEKRDDQILLKVSDNGLGIREEDKGKVFGVYKRLHNHVEGTGLGMTIVARIVENNRGRIEIDSEVGKGTTFNVYLNEMK